MLLPSEKPLTIQHRRLLQLGYTEADHLDELGKNDMAMLCRFIYQAPILPTMDPVSIILLNRRLAAGSDEIIGGGEFLRLIRIH